MKTDILLPFRKYTLIKYIFPIATFSFIYIFFNRYFEDIITNCFVLPFFSKFNSDGLLQKIIIGLVFLYVLVKLIIGAFSSRQKKIDLDIFFLFIPIIVFCLYYRLYSKSPWEPYWLIKSTLAYSDIIIVTIWLSLIKINFRKPSPEKTSQIELIEDNFNTFNSIDELGRQNFAERIAQYIQFTSTKKTFAIGISGKWGSGKSVLLDLIKKHLHSNAIIISYIPWKREKGIDIIDDFFNTLNKRLRTNDNEKLADSLLQYSKSIIKNNSNNVIQALEAFIDKFFNSTDDSPENIKEILESSKLVILLDDLDRLDKAEILEVFKLIRNSFDFPNTFFIVTYDREHVTKLLCEDSESYKQYLDKIFQLEMPLPVYPKDLIISNTIKLLKKNRSEEESMNISAVIDHLSFERFVKDGENKSIFTFFITNLRDAVRFVNSFNFSYTDNIKNDVELQDFIVLELLKVKYPLIYELLKDDFYFDNQQGILKLRNIDGFNFIQLLNKSHNDYLSTSEIGGINYTLSLLYGPTETPTNLGSIRYNSNKLTYFSSQLFNKVSPGVLKYLRKVNNRDEIFKQINIWNQENCDYEAYELISKVNNFDNFQDFNNVIFCLGYLSSILKGNDFSNDILIRIKAWYLSNKNLPELQGFLDNFLSDNRIDNLLRSHICYELITDQFNRTEMTIDIDLSLLKEINLNILKSFKFQGNSRPLYHLFIKNVDKIENDVYQTTEDAKLYLMDILTNNQELAKEYLDNILVPFYKEPNQKEAFTFQKQLLQIFEDDFEEFVNNQPPSIEKYEVQTFLRKTTPKNREFKTKRYVIEIISDSETKFLSSPAQNAICYSHPWNVDLEKEDDYKFLRYSKWIAHQYPLADDEATNGGLYAFSRNLFFDFARYKLKKATFVYVVDDWLTLKINDNLIITRVQTGNRIKKYEFQDLSVFSSNEIVLNFEIENKKWQDKWPPLKSKGEANPYGLIYNLILQFEKLPV